MCFYRPFHEHLAVAVADQVKILGLPLRIRFEKLGFRTLKDTTGQKLQGLEIRNVGVGPSLVIGGFGNPFVAWGNSPTRLACGVLTVKKGYRLFNRVIREGGSPVTPGPVPPKIFKILVPRSWYQDLRKAREAEPLGMQGGTGGCKPPARGSGRLEAPQEQQEVWGAASPQYKQFYVSPHRWKPTI